MDVREFFRSPQNTFHKQYEAIRSFFVDNLPVAEISKKFSYTPMTVYSLIRDFKQKIKEAKQNETPAEYFFKEPVFGRKVTDESKENKKLIILLRKKQLSIPDIKSVLDSQNKQVSERYIYNVLIEDGFIRLPRRDKSEKASLAATEVLVAPKTQLIKTTQESFVSSDGGLLVFLPYLAHFGIDDLIAKSAYPATSQLPKTNSILAFLALKLSNIRRYTADDLWCMDRGLGLFAGLNVLPKASWYTSYSSRITRAMNLSFLKEMTALWQQYGLLSDTVNMDFVTVPYWGEEQHLENNWSGTRHHALNSMLAALAHDPDSGIITYGDATIRHEDETQTVTEFLDFYRKSGNSDLKYLVFDSKFTIYENLRKLDKNNVLFLTIRRRGKKIIDELEALDQKAWKKVRVPMAGGRTRILSVNEQRIFVKSYGKELRQIAITGHGKIKPALIITNDFELSQEEAIRKYARRWLVEKTIAEQTHFFHLNRLSSSMVIKVDFDLTMSIFAHNLYRLLARDLPGFTNNTAQTLYDKFISNSCIVTCDAGSVTVKLKKKRNLPSLLEALDEKTPKTITWLNKRNLKIEGATTT